MLKGLWSFQTGGTPDLFVEPRRKWYLEQKGDLNYLWRMNATTGTPSALVSRRFGALESYLGLTELDRLEKSG